MIRIRVRVSLKFPDFSCILVENVEETSGGYDVEEISGGAYQSDWTGKGGCHWQSVVA